MSELDLESLLESRFPFLFFILPSKRSRPRLQIGPRVMMHTGLSTVCE